MKSLFNKLAIVLCLTVLFVSSSFSQNAYNKGDKVISLGIGYGLGGLYGSTSIPPISLGFDYGLEQKISIGGLVAYAGSSDDFLGGKFKYSYIVIGARGAYHFLEHNPNADVYAGVILGYNVVSASWDAPGVQPFGSSASASYALFGAFVGGRWYFSPRFGAFAELGYGAGFITAGVSFKL